MLHSKVYVFDRSDRSTAAFIGSHNLTGFALCGLNGEAGVLLEGPGASDPFPGIRAHINAALAESLQYDPNQRDAFAWWAGQFMEGLADKFDDYPRDGAKRTIVILAQHSGQGLPKSGDVIYFELPKAIGKVQSLSSEVHLYLFDKLPQSPFLALTNLAGARASLWCKTIGVEDDRGGKELQADWYVDGTRPVLRRAPRPFRPTPAADMQQVRAKAYKEVRGDFEYLFEPAKPAFDPIFDRTPTDRSAWRAGGGLGIAEARAAGAPPVVPRYRLQTQRGAYRRRSLSGAPQAHTSRRRVHTDVDAAPVEVGRMILRGNVTAAL